MTVQLFRLRGAPADEVDDIRELLTANGIEHYETPGGNWGISMPAIWLTDEGQLEKARSLIDRYQEQRLARARSEYERLRKEGNRKTIVDVVKENPLRFVVYLAVIAIIVYLSTKPFIDFGK